ncbi:MAG: ABC transporter substrate-binding protein, partial [Gammaproteobacteria bacterium]
MHIVYRIFLLFVTSLTSACSDYSLNNPYPADEGDRNIYYDTFSERPKHLDPARSYSSNEYVFLGQIYESPLQYHFLKRPYQLIPLTAKEMPVPIYQDREGNLIDEDTATEEIARVIYRITIKSDVMYQPHPALATGKIDDYIYHNLEAEDLKGIHTLADFKETGTRVLTAADYVYQIKRMAHPKIHSPIAGLMSQYILGLSELTTELTEEYKGSETELFLDLREYDLEGVRVIDDLTFEIVLKEKYPQFLYWLSMSFFAPMPWEADAFYSQSGMSDRNITLDWYPIGTGPFMLSENNPNRRMVLQRNPNFRGETFPEEGEESDAALGLLEDAGKAMPFVDKAIFSLEKESIPAWNKFLQGYYDTSGIVSDSFDQAVQFNTHGEAGLTEEMQDKSIQLLTAVTTSIMYTGFNMRDEVIGGDSERARKLRQAIAIAVDFEEFISIFANGR